MTAKKTSAVSEPDAIAANEAQKAPESHVIRQNSGRGQGVKEFKKTDPPKRSSLEEIGNAVTHGVGALFAIAAYLLMLVRCRAPLHAAAASIYFCGLIIMFTISCLYHSFPYGSKVKRLFRRFDYSCIYLLIGATYTPIMLLFIGGRYGITFCAVQWAVIAVGVTFVAIFGPGRLRWLHIPLYVLLGWSAVLFLPRMISLSPQLFFWILAGGVTYSLGLIPFFLKKKAAHFLWHFFVLSGAILQWTGIYFYIFMPL